MEKGFKGLFKTDIYSDDTGDWYIDQAIAGIENIFEYVEDFQQCKEIYMDMLEIIVKLKELKEDYLENYEGETRTQADYNETKNMFEF